MKKMLYFPEQKQNLSRCTACQHLQVNLDDKYNNKTKKREVLVIYFCIDVFDECQIRGNVME